MESDILGTVASFPSQVAEAFASAKDFVFPSSFGKVSNIVVLGMGGSGIVGDFLRVLLRNSSIPVYVSKHSFPPCFVNENSLVLAITNSGKTQETLDALETCINFTTQIVAVTNDHELESRCGEKNVPCIMIPKNGHTRSSLGYLLVPLLCMLQNASILRKVNYDVMETIEVLNKIKKECSPDLPLRRNPARSLAFDLLDRFPVIYGEQNFTDAAAIRWKQLFNENSKVHCYYDLFPELLHNEIEAWDSSTYENYALIVLRDSIYEREIGLQGKIKATKSLVEQKGAKIFEFWSQGRSELARLLSLSYLGDFASVYLGIARGIDTSSVHNIELIKGGL